MRCSSVAVICLAEAQSKLLQTAQPGSTSGVDTQPPQTHRPRTTVPPTTPHGAGPPRPPLPLLQSAAPVNAEGKTLLAISLLPACFTYFSALIITAEMRWVGTLPTCCGLPSSSPCVLPVPSLCCHYLSGPRAILDVIFRMAAVF